MRSILHDGSKIITADWYNTTLSYQLCSKAAREEETWTSTVHLPDQFVLSGAHVEILDFVDLFHDRPRLKEAQYPIGCVVSLSTKARVLFSHPLKLLLTGQNVFSTLIGKPGKEISLTVEALFVSPFNLHLEWMLHLQGALPRSYAMHKANRAESSRG